MVDKEDSPTVIILKEELYELEEERRLRYATDRLSSTLRLEELNRIILDVTNAIELLNHTV